MSRDIEVTTAVYIKDYQVVPEAAVEIIDNLESGYCPICSEGDGLAVAMPLPGECISWACEDCNVPILIEVWDAE